LPTLFLKQAFDFSLPVGINYEGGVLPEAVRQSIQILHRLGAMVFTLYMLGFTIFAIRKIINIPQLVKMVYVMWGLIFIQLMLGLINVVYKLPLVTAMSHTIIAVVLLLSMLTFIVKLATFSGKVSIK
jgi:cytochrome c oxidase assembly protein subunit 15